MAGLGRVALIFGNLCWIHGGYARCRVPHPGAHFVERHGLIVLIALGESIVTVGVGMAGRGLRADRVVTAVLGLDLAAALWWRYFDGEDEQAERVLDAAGVDHTTWLALYGFGYAFLPVLGGIIMFAAGIKNAVGHQAERLAEGVRVAGDLSVSGCG